MNKLVLALGAAASLLGPVPAAAGPSGAPSTEEARIPFLHIGRMRSFRAIDRDTLYVEAQRRQWYRVTMLGPCPNLPWAHVIGVDNHGGAVFDRFSTLLVDGDRCAIASVVRSDAPPPRRNRRRS